LTFDPWEISEVLALCTNHPITLFPSVSHFATFSCPFLFLQMDDDEVAEESVIRSFLAQKYLTQ
jgi:hypothetical protein